MTRSRVARRFGRKVDLGMAAAGLTEEKRNANMDLLRLLSMMMVTMLHALGKSDLLSMMSSDLPIGGWITWILEALSISAVNVFMLLSGYYLIHSKFKLVRLFELIFQVFFYVLVSLFVFVIAGKISLKSLTIYDALQVIFPVHMEVYWFITAYVVIYMLLPILSGGVKALTEKQFRITLICLLVYECAFKSVLPVRLTTDTKGYTFFWYVIVFMLGAYFRLYGFKFLTNSLRGVILYGLATIGCLAELFVLALIYLHTGRLKDMLRVSMDYNHVFTLLAAVGLFVSFLHAKPMAEKAGKLVIKLAPYALGVYLLQESLPLRYEWQNWFGLNGALEKSLAELLLRLFGAVVTMFVLGILADIVRSLLFSLILKLCCKKEKDACTK